MRYSKRKIITTAVIAFLCFSAIVFLIVKGINDSKKLTEADLEGRLTASVSNKKEEEKKQNNKTTKTKTKKTNETANEESNSSDEPHVVEVQEKKKVDTSFTGTYTVTELKKDDKTYTKEEIEELKKDGYSLSLTITKKGLATVSVLDIERQYDVTGTYFDDGNNKIEYSKNIGKIRIKIDNMEILFEKE